MTCTYGRRLGSAETSSARFFMVHARDPRLDVHPLLLITLPVCFILGMLIVLFFKCVTALFNPVYRGGKDVKWGLVSYTVIMFSLVTVHLATNLDQLSISYIDNRDFAGPVNGAELHGPYGYQAAINFKAISIIPRAAFRLNNWSADGLLVGSFLTLWSLVRVPNTSSPCSSIVATYSIP